mmetsp:Transcript_6678/g.24057  ORF Transcript_6678/g.24057 Transcript_6678/m.24057 type:complete len:222 (+) Transcript_6678:50-715(+)
MEGLDQIMERRVHNTALKDSLDVVRRSFFVFESTARPSATRSPEEARSSFLHLNNAIDALGLSFNRLVNSNRALDLDRDRYEDLRKESRVQSEVISREIDGKKAELEEAKKVKEFYEECEKLKEDIVQIPSCSKLTKNIQEAEVETATMAKHVQRMDDLNEHRKVLLDSLLVSLGELERSMEDPEKLNKLRAEEGLVAAIKKEVGEIVEASKREQEMTEAG